MVKLKSKRAVPVDPNALVAETESGARNPTGAIPKKILFYVPLILDAVSALVCLAPAVPFQRFCASTTPRHGPFTWPLPSFCPIRPIPLSNPHRETTFRCRTGSWPGGRFLCVVPVLDFYAQLSDRPGDPPTLDLIVAVIGLIMLLEATRRALGPPLMVVATVFHHLHLCRAVYAGGDRPQGGQP
jgi:hypothetical protein